MERLTAATSAARVGFRNRAGLLQCSQKNVDARAWNESAGVAQVDDIQWPRRDRTVLSVPVSTLDSVLIA